MEKLYAIAQQFTQGAVTAVEAYGAGNVNDTYLVTLAAPSAPIGGRRFILQRVNTHVFPQPALILLNMRVFLTHMEERLAQNSAAPGGWRMPRVITTAQDTDYYMDDAGAFWRAISLIEGAKTYPSIRDAAHAREAGYALGRFHSLLSDLDPVRLHDTLPGFHITPGYLDKYDQVLAHAQEVGQRAHGARTSDVAYSLRFVEARRAFATVLEDATARGELPPRSIHGDPKVDNILIDDQSGQAISIIDLDTVKPGLVHYDIGDCLRSCCNPAGEETLDLSQVIFDTNLCRAILQGYLPEVARFFTEADYHYLYASIRLISFELGLRFFTDYLAGDVYFKVRYPEHNLQRALVQFRLVESVEAQETAIEQIIAEQR